VILIIESICFSISIKFQQSVIVARTTNMRCHLSCKHHDAYDEVITDQQRKHVEAEETENCNNGTHFKES